MAPSRTSSSRIKTAHNLDLEGFQESQFVSSSHHNSKQNRSISEQIQFLELVRVTTDYVRQPDHRRHRLWSFGDSPSSPSTPSWMYREGGGQEDWRSRGPQVDGGGGAVEGPRMEAWRKVRETTSERRAREAPRDFVNACAVWPRKGAKVCNGTTDQCVGPCVRWWKCGWTGLVSKPGYHGACPGQPNGPKLLPSIWHVLHAGP